MESSVVGAHTPVSARHCRKSSTGMRARMTGTTSCMDASLLLTPCPSAISRTLCDQCWNSSLKVSSTVVTHSPTSRVCVCTTPFNYLPDTAGSVWQTGLWLNLWLTPSIEMLWTWWPRAVTGWPRAVTCWPRAVTGRTRTVTVWRRTSDKVHNKSQLTTFWDSILYM